MSALCTMWLAPKIRFGGCQAPPISDLRHGAAKGHDLISAKIQQKLSTYLGQNEDLFPVPSTCKAHLQSAPGLEQLWCCCRSGHSNGFQLCREERCPNSDFHFDSQVTPSAFFEATSV